MARVDPSPELFKLYSEEDQNEILAPRQSEMEQSGERVRDIGQSKNQAERDYARWVQKMEGGSSTGSQIASNTLSTKDDQHGGFGAAIDVLFSIPSRIRSSYYGSEYKEASADHDEKKAAYHGLADTKNNPTDPVKLDQELDALYEAQKNNYYDYVSNQNQIARSEKLLEDKKNRGDLFGYGTVEDRIEKAKNNLVDLEADYYANIDLLAMAEDQLPPEKLERFYALEAKMGAAIQKTKGVQVEAPPEPPPPPPPPPQPAPSVPIVQRFVTAGAKLQCSFGAACTLNVNRPMTLLENAPMANIMDFAPFTCIVPTGTCSAPTNPAVIAAMGSPVPCTPLIVAPWAVGKPDVLVENFPALLSTDKCFCAYGGVISIMP